MPSLTLAIPFYKNCDYLGRAVRSVLAQTSTDWELVISDDAGPEGDVSAFLPRDDRIRYVRQPRNLGLAGNWNMCLDLSRSDLVTLLHADDELEPNYVALMTEAAHRRPEAAVYFCQAQVIDANGRPVFSFPDWYKRWLLPARGRECVVEGEAGLKAIYRGNFIMCPTMCYRRAVLPNPTFDGRWRQVLDLDLITRLLLKGRTFVGLPEIAYRYRRHDDNQTKVHSDSLTRFIEECDLFDETAENALAQNWNAAAATCRRKAIIQLNLAFCILQDTLRLRARHAAAKAKFLGSVIWGRRRSGA